MAKQIMKRDRMVKAHEDYDYGYETPIFKHKIEGGATHVEKLDRAEMPDALRKMLKRVDVDLADVEELTIKALSHVYILHLESGAIWMLRKCGKELHVYDCSGSVTHSRPSLGEVARWHDINPPHLRTIAAGQKWADNRAMRLREQEAETMAVMRGNALEDFQEAALKRLNRVARMEAKYDESLDNDSAIITTRDVLSASALGQRIHKEMVTIGKAENPMQNFINILVEAGIAEVEETAEIIDAEVEALPEENPPPTDGE